MEHGGAATLLVLALGAFVVPLLSERIRIPAVVGEILFGMLIAEHGLDLIRPTEFTRFLAEFGFAFLMFLAGMEIDFTRIRKMGRRGLLAATGAAVAVNVLAFGAVILSGRPLFLALVIGAMSLGLVMATLRIMGLLRTPMGQTILLVGTWGEFITLILLTIGGIATIHGVGWPLVLSVGKLGLVFGLAWVCLVVLRTLVWWFPETFSRVVSTGDAAEVGVRASLALMLAFVAVASLLGVETILGAFLAGALFSFAFRGKEAIETKLSSIGFGFFIPMFFIDVGMSFDTSGLLRGDFWGHLGFIAGASVAVKLAPMALLLLLGLRFRQTVASGVLLAAPLTLLVAMSRIGAQIGAIDSATAFSIVLFAILGGVVLPILFRLLAVGGSPRAPRGGSDPDGLMDAP